MLVALIQICGGLLLLVWAADRLVAGASATARNLGVSPLIIGLTIVGFGTSAPELVVSATAALDGKPGLAVGNAIGSNIANIGLILGFTAIVYPLRVESNTLKREYPLLMLIMLATLWMALDYHYSRVDGVILLVILVLLLMWMVRLGLKRKKGDPLEEEFDAEIPSDMPTPTALFWLLVGLIVLPISSKFLVDGAITVAEIMGVSETIIGLTIVAFGTSLPELAAAVTSALRREDDLAIGNVIGSNMFNLLGVLGIAASLAPTTISSEILTRDMPVMFLLTAMLFFMAYGFKQPGRIRRQSGFLLLALFLSYQTYIIYQALNPPAAL